MKPGIGSRQTEKWHQFNGINESLGYLFSPNFEKENELKSLSGVFFRHYLNDFLQGFIQIEFSFVNLYEKESEFNSTLFDEGFSFLDLEEDSKKIIIEDCLNFLIDNQAIIFSLDRLRKDPFFCGQGFSLGRRLDEFCFMVGPHNREESRQLFESSKMWEVYDYEPSASGIKIV